MAVLRVIINERTRIGLRNTTGEQRLCTGTLYPPPKTAWTLALHPLPRCPCRPLPRRPRQTRCPYPPPLQGGSGGEGLGQG